ncbi:MAG: diaminobutyrate--2-oxoglutarate transaminase [Gammaproteobacteria bacterium HGW-Gammaproteobacteria-14]|nr:MAG: diaminobutyrate--2-oxoglutarate transaminase [Gammaproteobacteria bacterium HGW-Gammaproteobacteria-14]
MDTDVFDRIESEVQSYARSFPVLFSKAKGSYLYDENGEAYLDFLAGAGTLNYGHNNPVLKEKLLAYLSEDYIVHGLDMHTVAKRNFLSVFEEVILKPRNMEYIMQFTGPTGTNAVEAALKIARNIKGRSNIITFTNGFHGVSLGALATTGNSHHRGASGVSLTNTSVMPYDGYLGTGFDTTEMIDKMLSDSSSGIDHPAAVIVETVQGEGGINAASFEWLRNLEKVCKKHDMLMIVDDIQAGCGRTGSFFSFDEAGIKPDIITLSKSLSGYGLPFSVVLMKPELDQWKPGEHNGTFRGHNPAFVTATAALDHYWRDNTFATEIKRKGEIITKHFREIANRYDDYWFHLSGRGMMQGLVCRDGALADAITSEAFTHKMVVETSGADDHVIKTLCPLTISEEDLVRGLQIISDSVDVVMKDKIKQQRRGKVSVVA